MKSVLIMAVVAAALTAAAPALAAPPPNDAFADAQVVTALPYTDSQQIGEATTEPGEPQWCSSSSQTIWYAVTPSSDGFLVAADAGGGVPFSTTFYRQTGAGIASLQFIGCGGGFGAVRVEAGETYYVQAGSFFGFVGSLRLSLSLVPPPPNDDFTAATAIDKLPFSESIDTKAAGTETGEPASSCGGAGSTVWYAYRPAVTGSVTAKASWMFPPALAVYTGSGIGSLTQVRCSNSGVLTFAAQAGETYWIRAAHPDFGFFVPQLTFSLDVAPPPNTVFGFSPGDPSIFDTVQFFDFSSDPAEIGISSRHFDFGDGTSADGCCPTHRYAADGNYTVTDTVATPDGRSASQTQTVSVRTHDVTIAKLTVPQSGSAGQTRSITVGVTDARYPETVAVELQRSAPGGDFVTVGTLTQDVPLRSLNRTTSFAFTYTFRSEDATVGKVTFKAVATIAGARDALPGDNVAIALPTKVGR